MMMMVIIFSSKNDLIFIQEVLSSIIFSTVFKSNVINIIDMKRIIKNLFF